MLKLIKFERHCFAFKIEAFAESTGVQDGKGGGVEWKRVEQLIPRNSGTQSKKKYPLWHLN